MFFRKRVAVKNAATLTLPPPSHIHHHQSSQAVLFLAKFGAAIISLFVAWFILCGLFEQMGSRQPGRDVATFLVFGVVGSGLLILAGWGIGNVIDKFFRAKIELTRVSREYDLQFERVRLLAAQTNAIGPRSLDADYNMARLALAVLQKAYDLKRPYRPNEKRPWKRDNAFAIAKDFAIEGITTIRAGRLEDWLTENRFILDDQINRGRYQEFEDARRQIDLIAAPPLVINPPTSDYREMSIIKNAN